MCVAFHWEALLISWAGKQHDYLIHVFISRVCNARHFYVFPSDAFCNSIQMFCLLCLDLTGYDVDLIPKITSWSFISAPGWKENSKTRVFIHFTTLSLELTFVCLKLLFNIIMRKKNYLNERMQSCVCWCRKMNGWGNLKASMGLKSSSNLSAYLIKNCKTLNKICPDNLNGKSKPKQSQKTPAARNSDTPNCWQNKKVNLDQTIVWGVDFKVVKIAALKHCARESSKMYQYHNFM